jgi:ribonuclease HII
MNFTFETELLGRHSCLGKFPVVGVDEVGRGCLAGPVVAAALGFSDAWLLGGGPGWLGRIQDSKRLSAEVREELFLRLHEHPEHVKFAIGSASVQEVDQLNILHATLLAMERAVAGWLDRSEGPLPFVLVDGNRTPSGLKNQVLACESVVGGDGQVLSIAAASILAKVSRDRQMVEAAQDYPEYGFEKHKGYGTKIHLNALQRWGLTPLHRRSFWPVRACEVSRS